MSVHHLPPPASPWPEGEPAGERQFLDIGAIDLERGGHLPDVTVAYETWGTLNAAADNAVLVEHANHAEGKFAHGVIGLVDRRPPLAAGRRAWRARLGAR